MQLRLFLNSARHHPICRTVRLEKLTGEAILASVRSFSEPSRRETAEFAFSQLYRNPGKPVRSEPGTAVLVLDSQLHSENVERFDFFREEWTRILFLTEENGGELLVRNCTDSYSVWCFASLSENGTKPQWHEAEDWLSVEKLLAALPELIRGDKTLTPLSQWSE